MPPSRRRPSSQRSRYLTIAGGAIAAVIILLVAGVAIYRYATRLGPDELPSSIGNSEREDIQEAIQLYFDAVNQYNPQLVAETMLEQPTGTPDLDRMIMSLAALESEKLTFQIVNLGSVSLDEAQQRVNARVVTNYGQKDFILTRAGGHWRVVNVPDLRAPQEAGPLRFEWEVLNTYKSDDGSALAVVGQITNTGDQMGYTLSTSGYITDEAGATVTAGRVGGLPGSPFIHPEETRYFRLDFRIPEGVALDPARLVLVPDIRPAGPNDEAVTARSVSIDPATLPWQSGIETTATIANEETTAVRVYPVAHFKDASGQLIGLIRMADTEIPAGMRETLRLPGTLAQSLAATASVEITLWAVRRN